MNNNKRGFTLIELIGVIIIISLLVLIITPVINNVIINNKEKLYQQTLDNIVVSAKNWASDSENKDLLPIDNNNCVVVTLAQLKSGGYVDLNVKDPRNGNALSNSIAVLITKHNNRYDYEIKENGASGTSCTANSVDPTAPVIAANIFSGFRKTFGLKITYSSDYGLKSTNSYQYYLSDKYDSLSGGSWKDYTSNVSQTIGSGLNGSYYLFVKRIENESNIISSSGGAIVNISTDSYHRFGPYNFDNTKPIWRLYEKTNDNTDDRNSLENMNFAYKDSTVTLKIRGTDNNYSSNTLTESNIDVYIGSTKDTTIEKSLTAGTTLSNGIEYILTLTNFEKTGDLIISIPKDTLVDAASNKNDVTTINTGIKSNGCIYAVNEKWTFETVGETETFKVPCQGTYKIQAYGAQGMSVGGGEYGGKGAYVYGNITLSRNTELYINIGGQGTEEGGANGGGALGGGGSTDIRAGGYDLSNRIMVAAGGGAGMLLEDGTGLSGGNGGLATGGNGVRQSGISLCSSCLGSKEGAYSEPGTCSAVDPDNVKTCVGRVPTGGSQSAGGLYGVAWHINPYVGYWSGYSGKLYYGGSGSVQSLGGGGGYYGGGGAAVSATHNVSGAGGSSCISGASGYSCNVSGYSFTSTGGTAGNKTGNGKVVITLVSY